MSKSIRTNSNGTKLLINKELVPNRVIKFQLDSVGKYIINSIRVDSKFNQIRWNNNVLKFMTKESNTLILHELYINPTIIETLDDLVKLINDSWNKVNSTELSETNTSNELIQYKNNQYQFSLPIIPIEFDRKDKILYTNYETLIDETLIGPTESTDETKNIYLYFSHTVDGLWELLGVKPFVVTLDSRHYTTIQSNYIQSQYNSNIIITPYKLVNPITKKIIDKNTVVEIENWMFKTTIQQQFEYNLNITKPNLNIYLYSSDIYETTLNFGSNQSVYTITDYVIKDGTITLDLNIRELTINPNQQYFIYVDTIDGYGFNSMSNAQLEVLILSDSVEELS